MQYPSETPCLLNQVYSLIPITELSEYLYEMATGENEFGSKQKGREREIGMDKWSERRTIGEIWKQRRLEMTIGEKDT